ncbi:MAG: SDR family oxidoreductase [Bryobacteraceae bacterium]|nr:SDR family oxidoreductase [Bryobacteraceae bacterium]
MADETVTRQRPEPPFPEQEQEFPGVEQQLRPKADHGEKSYRGMNRLKDKVALITGADSGIGRAVAIAYAREGADVIISYYNEEQDARETERYVTEAGRKAVRIGGDIQDENHCSRMVEQIVDEFGRIDILVNNAAYQMTFDSIEEISAEEIDRAFRTNVFAMFYLCREAIPKMKPGSSIINTTSIQAYDPTPTLLPYSSTKGAIVTFTKGLAKWVVKQGIRVNAVAPGPVWTPLIPYSMPQEKVTEFGKTAPMERPAQPAELAPVYVFLASEDAAYITGEVIGVTGGRLLP